MCAVRKRHLLLVEDNLDELEELRRLLQQEGFTVDVAVNGREALDPSSRIRSASRRSCSLIWACP
jgi:DNA-binding response OmpR family regulator